MKYQKRYSMTLPQLCIVAYLQVKKVCFPKMTFSSSEKFHGADTAKTWLYYVSLSLSVDVYNFSVYFYIYGIVYKNHSYPLEKKWTHDSYLSYESLSIKCIY